MKTKANNKKYNAIKALLKNRDEGLQPIPGCRKNLKQIRFTVEDHEDYLMRIRALLEVCVFALEGQGSFCSKKFTHITKDATVNLVLEMAIDLLPTDQMVCMDRIKEIIFQEFGDNLNNSGEKQAR
ncbi:hypothetical protein GCM10007103_09780 [Salinimicrobium marinum]|uniref:Uncharacterized protein n=1 Tax=Salinimicrobium marinum TaxID=680283 RepID=A0A918SAV2_9FLAO|nr:hypothetical protein [Salinimicrobium marinum]GHA30441.1 hypothetical protein GCM10007103_09780 [Salinimicrobium marinum]